VQALAREPARHVELARAIAAATDELERHFAGHLRREEEVIFPAMRRLLDRAADEEVVGSEWTLLAILAAGQPGDAGREDEELRTAGFRLVDRMVGDARHQSLIGAAEDDGD